MFKADEREIWRDIESKYSVVSALLKLVERIEGSTVDSFIELESLAALQFVEAHAMEDSEQRRERLLASLSALDDVILRVGTYAAKILMENWAAPLGAYLVEYKKILSISRPDDYRKLAQMLKEADSALSPYLRSARAQEKDVQRLLGGIALLQESLLFYCSVDAELDMAIAAAG